MGPTRADPGPRGQLRALRADASGIVQGRWRAALALPFDQAFAIVAWYRLNRAAHLHLGRGYQAVRIGLTPLQPLIRLVVRCEIDYRADLGPGLRILHPQLGVVVSRSAVAGTGLILVGGNVLGARSVLGDGVQLGANAVVVEDVTVGDRVVLGAGAVAVQDLAGPGTAVGVPARMVRRTDDR